MIDRQELIAVLDLRNVGRANSMRTRQQILAFREELADAILKLEGGDRDAAQERPEPQGDQLEHPARSEGRQTEEAGGGHRSAEGGEVPPLTRELIDGGTFFHDGPPKAKM